MKMLFQIPSTHFYSNLETDIFDLNNLNLLFLKKFVFQVCVWFLGWHLIIYICAYIIFIKQDLSMLRPCLKNLLDLEVHNMLQFFVFLESSTSWTYSVLIPRSEVIFFNQTIMPSNCENRYSRWRRFRLAGYKSLLAATPLAHKYKQPADLI